MGQKSENKAGLFITVIFHLTVIIILLLYHINTTINREYSFVIDFTQQEELERRQREEEEELKKIEEELAMAQDILRNLEAKIAAKQSTSSPVRNIISNEGGPLEDDRGTDAQQLYEDAAELDKRLKEGMDSPDGVDLGKNSENSKPKKDDKPKGSYSGASVLRYDLNGRDARYLKTPAYRCFDGGEITVIIEVDRSGRVKKASIQEDVSSTNDCLRREAINAAKVSRFIPSETSPEIERGYIVYQFIAQ